VKEIGRYSTFNDNWGNNMSDENKLTSMGKWSVAFALISLAIVALLLLCLIIPMHSKYAEGEGGLGAAAIIGLVILCGIIVIIITSLAGTGLAIGALYKTSRRQGIAGLLLNIAALIIIAAFLLWYIH
jgi:hypothetical protein